MGLGGATPREGIPLKRAEGLVLIMETPKGRGVFASKDIPSRTILEVCPVLVLDPVENKEHIEKTELYNYTYNWPYTLAEDGNGHVNGDGKPPTTTQAIILGLGSMFNHSNVQQNVGWERDIENRLITYSALRDIKEGEELCISYGQRLTFKDTEAEEEMMAREPDDMEEWLNYTELMD